MHLRSTVTFIHFTQGKIKYRWRLHEGHKRGLPVELSVFKRSRIAEPLVHFITCCMLHGLLTFITFPCLLPCCKEYCNYIFRFIIFLSLTVTNRDFHSFFHVVAKVYNVVSLFSLKELPFQLL